MNKDNPEIENLFENAELDKTQINLQDEMEEDEEDFLPPQDDNEAREINVGTIFAVIFIGIAIIMMILMFAGGKNVKKKNNQNKLAKAGSKFEIEFEGKGNEENEILSALENTTQTQKAEQKIEEEINSLTEPAQPTVQQQAPVTPVGKNNYRTTGNERPDTRNSKSPRTIKGLAGQNNQNLNTNQSIINAAINGNIPQNSGPRLSKEEYIDNFIKQSQQYGNPGGIQPSSNSYAGLDKASYAQQNKESFYFNGYGEGGNGEFLPYNSLWDGTVISGALVTAINTDNPGVITARVTENIYSSYDHSFLLIPEGSLLFATYNSSISYGQDKVQVAWNLLIRPDGYRITLGNMNGVNAQGESGYKGKVNNHTWQTFKALGMIAMYSVIQTEAVNEINDQKNEYIKNAMSDVYAQSAKIGNKIIDRALDIKPTITIKSGTEIKLITNTPLVLPPVEVNQVTRKYIRKH